VVNKFNKENINEELEKMKRLAGYKYSDDNKKVDTKQIETMSESINNFRELLNN
jgi:ferritin